MRNEPGLLIVKKQDSKPSISIHNKSPLLNDKESPLAKILS